MTWNYSQSTGVLSLDGEQKGVGYSGRGAGRNNPATQDVRDVGPIPQGRYRIGSSSASYPSHLGAAPVMALTPTLGTQTFARSGFFMHGNDSSNDASHGCIVLDHATRVAIAESDDRDLIVTE